MKKVTTAEASKWNVKYAQAYPLVREGYTPDFVGKVAHTLNTTGYFQINESKLRSALSHLKIATWAQFQKASKPTQQAIVKTVERLFRDQFGDEDPSQMHTELYNWQSPGVAAIYKVMSQIAPKMIRPTKYGRPPDPQQLQQAALSVSKYLHSDWDNIVRLSKQNIHSIVDSIDPVEKETPQVPGRRQFEPSMMEQ